MIDLFPFKHDKITSLYQDLIEMIHRKRPSDEECNEKVSNSSYIFLPPAIEGFAKLSEQNKCTKTDNVKSTAEIINRRKELYIRIELNIAEISLLLAQTRAMGANVIGYFHVDSIVENWKNYESLVKRQIFEGKNELSFFPLSSFSVGVGVGVVTGNVGLAAASWVGSLLFTGIIGKKSREESIWKVEQSLAQSCEELLAVSKIKNGICTPQAWGSLIHH